MPLRPVGGGQKGRDWLAAWGQGMESSLLLLGNPASRPVVGAGLGQRSPARERDPQPCNDNLGVGVGLTLESQKRGRGLDLAVIRACALLASGPFSDRAQDGSPQGARKRPP